MKRASKKDIERVRLITGREKKLEKISRIYNDTELDAIARGGFVPTEVDRKVIDFSGSSVRFLVCSDTHIGGKHDRRKWIDAALREGKREKCDILLHVGDLADGMGGGKGGYVQDLRVIGVDAQITEAADFFSEWKNPAYIVSGNHDLWAWKSEGIDIVEHFCTRTGWHYLGQGQGVLKTKGSVIELFHGEDSASAYVYSYRIQQITRAITGGYKPNILITGHDHKSLYVYTRMIHCLGAGALSSRSRFLQQKRTEHHSGFWISTVYFEKRGGVSKITNTWYPFYG